MTPPLPAHADNTLAASSVGSLNDGASHDDRAAAPHAPAFRGLVVGLAAGASVYVATSSGALPGAVGNLLALGALALTPTTTRLSSRIAVNGSIGMAWLPLLWWLHWPFQVNHASLSLAVVVASLTAYVAGGRRFGQRTRRLLPEVRSTDLLLPAAALAALAAVHNLALAQTPTRALQILLPGADNWVHFNIFATMRAEGSLLGAAGTSPDGSGFAYASYPAHFHAWIATLSELSSARLQRGPESLLAYGHGVAAFVVIGAVVMTAALVSLPGVAGRLGVATPATALTLSAFLWEPGQKILANGFASFWMASMAAGTALVLSLPSKSARAFPTTIAVAGLLVAVAHTWTLLLIPASPAAALVLLGPFGRKATRAENKRLAMCLVIFAVAGLACLKAAIMLLTTVDVSFLVSAFGGLNGTSPYPLFVLIIVSIYLCFSSPAWFDRRGIVDGRRTAQRIRLAVACPALGVTLGAVIFVAQMRTLGTTSYYLLKYLMGVELILALLVAAVAAFLVGSVTQRRAAPQSMAAAVCATLAASQFFGVIPGRTGLLLSETDDGTASVASPYDRAAMAEGIVRAAGSRPEGPSFGRDYFAVGPGRAAEAFYTDGWFHAVDASLSNAVMDRVNLLRVSVDDQDGATAALRLLLAHEGKPEVVVAPRELVRLRRSLPDGAPSSRVVSWNSKQAPVAP